MVNIIKNKTLVEFENIIKNDFKKNYHIFPKELLKSEKEAMKVFKNRIQLEEIIDTTLKLNQSINWKSFNKNIKLVNYAEDLINVFKLRSDVYRPLGYLNEFLENIPGLNYDNYDKYSIILIGKENNKIIGTTRVILDSKLGLQSEKIPEFQEIYKNLRYNNPNKRIVEGSRTVIDSNFRGSQILKYFFRSMYELYDELDIGVYTSCMLEEMNSKLYSNIGFEILKKSSSYSNIEKEVVLLSWTKENLTPFFKRGILK